MDERLRGGATRLAAHSTAAVGGCTALMCPPHRKLKKEEIQKYYDIKEKLGTSVERDTHTAEVEEEQEWRAARGSLGCRTTARSQPACSSVLRDSRATQWLLRSCEARRAQERRQAVRDQSDQKVKTQQRGVGGRTR